jgi:tetratricopeptide (TPR) repeat protein
MRLLRDFFVSLLTGFGIFKALSPLWALARSAWNAGPLRVLSAFVMLFVRMFWGVIRWCGTLNLRLFFQGLPALVVGAAATIVSIMALLAPQQELVARYGAQAKSAAKAKRFDEALACHERLAQLQRDRADAVYEMAVAAEGAGQLGRCALLMQQLAPPDAQGYAKAHLWNAARLLARKGDEQQSRQLAESHLLRALEAGLDDKEAAHGLLGELYLTKGLCDQAEPHLLIAVKTKPQMRLRLAQLYALQGNQARAKSEAQAMANFYSTAAKADLFAHYARIKWAEATVFLEDFPQAVAILEEGLSGTNENLYRTGLAGVYVTWFDFLTRKGNSSPGLRLAILERGLRADPKNLALLDRVLAVLGMRSQTLHSPSSIAAIISAGAFLKGPQLACVTYRCQLAEADEARDKLRQLLAKGEVTAPIHFALGVDAWQNGRAQEAQLHWERAFQLAPDTPALANNLAWLLYQTDAKQLSKALDLVNLAIAKAPQETNFRDTRGHILVKMGRFKDALPDLEAALPRSPNSANLHRTLAQVYSQLELPAMATEHERLARELTRGKEN